MQQINITAKDSHKVGLQKETSAIVRISFTLGGGEKTKNNKLLTSYQVIITCNKQYYIH